MQEAEEQGQTRSALHTFRPYLSFQIHVGYAAPQRSPINPSFIHVNARVRYAIFIKIGVQYYSSVKRLS